MNYKLLKGGHLPEKKCREILELFCDDRTATQIAGISGVSRVTVNNYFRLFRSAIASFCEERAKAEQISDFICDGTNEGENGIGAYYGLSFNQGSISAEWLKTLCVPINNHREGTDPEAVVAQLFTGNERYIAIADCSNWRLYGPAVEKRTVTSNHPFSEIRSFWNFTKRRLQKFRGTSRSTLYLHIKECEFRYNFSNDDVFSLISNVIR